jgi:hypothetical protein
MTPSAGRLTDSGPQIFAYRVDVSLTKRQKDPSVKSRSTERDSHTHHLIYGAGSNL